MQLEMENESPSADKRDIASAIEHTLYGFDVVIAQSLDCIHQELALNMDNETLNHVRHGSTTTIDHLVCPALEQKHVPDDPLSQLHEDVLQDLKESTGQILDDLRTYHRSRHELVLMFHDIPQDKADQLMNAMEDERMEDERNVALQESIWQEQEGQRKQEQEVNASTMMGLVRCGMTFYFMPT